MIFNWISFLFYSKSTCSNPMFKLLVVFCINAILFYYDDVFFVSLMLNRNIIIFKYENWINISIINDFCCFSFVDQLLLDCQFFFNPICQNKTKTINAFHWTKMDHQQKTTENEGQLFVEIIRIFSAYSICFFFTIETILVFFLNV